MIRGAKQHLTIEEAGVGKWKLLLAGVLVCITVLFFAGCRTSDQEWTGAMANQNGSHVQPFNPQNEAQNNQAIRPFAPLSSVGEDAFAAVKPGANSNNQPGQR